VIIVKNGSPTFNLFQVKFTKHLDEEKACKSVTYSKFYCSSKTKKPIKGYEKQHKDCKTFFSQQDPQTIKRYVVHQGMTHKEINDPGVILISQKEFPNYFDSLNIGPVWKYLAEIQNSHFQQ
jgi:hypothetical protein